MVRKLKTGGGWPAVWYTLRKAREVGGILKLWQAMRSKNACKTCALGMGGQPGGMVNEAGHFPEVCKKSLQAMVADMQGGHQAGLLQHLLDRPAAGLLAARAGTLRPASQPAAATQRGAALLPADSAGTRRSSGSPPSCKPLSPDETFWYFSGRSRNEAGFLLQLFARLYGTNNVNNCSYYCHQASGVGLPSVTGQRHGDDDARRPRARRLRVRHRRQSGQQSSAADAHADDVRRRGGQVIVINPVVETGLVHFSVPSDVRSLLFGTKIATLYVQPHIGGDLALLTGIAKRIVEMGAQDEAFLRRALRRLARTSSSIWRASAVERDHRKVGRRSRKAIDADRRALRRGQERRLQLDDGHHASRPRRAQRAGDRQSGPAARHGRPAARRADADSRPLERAGHRLGRRHAEAEGRRSSTACEQHFGVKLPTTPGLDTMACIEAAAAGELKFGFCLGGNLYGSNPDAEFAAEALANLDLLVYLNTTLNTGHAHGLARETIILPVLARDEEPQPTTQESMFNYIRLSDGGPRRHEGPRSEIEVVSLLADRVLGAIDADRLARDRAHAARFARRSPRCSRLREPGRDRPHEAGVSDPRPDVSRRADSRPPAAEPSCTVHELPDLETGDGQLRLMTVRSEGQFNTVVYEDYDLYRGQDRRDVILLHPDDMPAAEVCAPSSASPCAAKSARLPTSSSAPSSRSSRATP